MYSLFSKFKFILVLVFIFGCNRQPSELIFKSRDNLERRRDRLLEGKALSYINIDKYILRPYCISCHKGNGAPQKLDFTSYRELTKKRFASLFIKGKPKRSRFYISLTDGSMPPKSLPLTKVELRFVADWIKAGTPKIPGDDEPGDDEPGDDEPGDDEPGDDEPGDDEPGDDEPGDDEPSD